MARLSKLLFLGLAAAQVATLSAQITLTGGACPTTGSTVAISCYDNGGMYTDDSLAQQDQEPIGGICFKSACPACRLQHAHACLTLTPPRAATPVTYTDPTDGAWYWQGGSSSPADCTTEVQGALAGIALGSPTVTTATITYCTTDDCNSGTAGNGAALLAQALSGASANAVAGAAVAVAVAVAAAVM
jgi:hypothetical protein